MSATLISSLSKTSGNETVSDTVMVSLSMTVGGGPVAELLVSEKLAAVATPDTAAVTM